MKATEQYFPMVLFIMLYKVVLTFASVDEILKCDHLNESYWAVHSFSAVYYAVQGDWLWWWNTMNSSVTIKKKAAGQNFRVVLTLYYVVEGGGDLGDEILSSSLSY